MSVFFFAPLRLRENYLYLFVHPWTKLPLLLTHLTNIHVGIKKPRLKSRGFRSLLGDEPRAIAIP